MDICRGDCFSQYSFMNTEEEADEHLEKTCKQLCAHSSWIRYVFQFKPKHTIGENEYERVLITTAEDQWLKYWDGNTGKDLYKAKLPFSVHVIQELLCDISLEENSNLEKNEKNPY